MDHDVRIVGRTLPRSVDHAKVKGSVRVGQTLPLHLLAQGSLRLRPRRMGCVRAPQGQPSRSLAMIASANADVPTSLAPSICRARSYVTTFDARTAFTWSRSLLAASSQPRCSSIMTPTRISAVGFTLSRPAYFGALPWIGSKEGDAAPRFPPRAPPGP